MNIIQHNLDHDICIAEIEGRVDFNTAPALTEFFNQVSFDGINKIIIDMGGVSYMNSDSLHILADFQQKTRQHGGDLRLVRLSPVVQKVFQIVGFRRFFRNYSSVETARMGW